MWSGWFSISDFRSLPAAVWVAHEVCLFLVRSLRVCWQDQLFHPHILPDCYVDPQSAEPAHPDASAELSASPEEPVHKMTMFHDRIRWNQVQLNTVFLIEYHVMEVTLLKLFLLILILWYLSQYSHWLTSCWRCTLWFLAISLSNSVCVLLSSFSRFVLLSSPSFNMVSSELCRWWTCSCSAALSHSVEKKVTHSLYHPKINLVGFWVFQTGVVGPPGATKYIPHNNLEKILQ